MFFKRNQAAGLHTQTLWAGFLCVCLLQPSVKSLCLILPSGWPWVVTEWVEYIKSPITSVNENTNEPPTDGQTDRAHMHTHALYIYTPVSNEALMQNAITSNCLSEKKRRNCLAGMTAGSTLLTQEEAVDFYWAALYVWQWIFLTESVDLEY